VGTPELVKLRRNSSSLHRERARSAQVSLKSSRFRRGKFKIQEIEKRREERTREK
jgi:hypothetical protein